MVGTLAGAGVAALPLKGPLLASDLHGDLGLRETADVDLLVARTDLEQAVRTLVGEGFSQAPEARRADGLPGLHDVLRHPSLGEVELHWRIHWYEERFAGDMLARAEPAADGFLRPQPDDLAAALLLFYARDGFHGVRMAADIGAWWDRHGAELPAAFLEGHARRYPALAPALTAAAHAAERVVGVPAPSWLGAAAAAGPRVALATRLSDWAQDGDLDQLAANISLVGALLGPRGSTGDFARRELLPPGLGARRRAVHAVEDERALPPGALATAARPLVDARA